MLFSVGLILFQFLLLMEIQALVDSLSQNDLNITGAHQKTVSYLSSFSLSQIVFFSIFTARWSIPVIMR